MADDERDEKDRYTYIRFTDKAFGKFCQKNYDLNHDGRVSRYEARRILEMDCSSLGILSLSDLENFGRLRNLNCSDNQLPYLDLRFCPELRVVNCSKNQLVGLRLNGLRTLGKLNCSQNQLEQLELEENSSLLVLDCRQNRLKTLDVGNCYYTMELWATENPDLTTLYIRWGQQVTPHIDGHTVIEQR